MSTIPRTTRSVCAWNRAATRPSNQLTATSSTRSHSAQDLHHSTTTWLPSFKRCKLSATTDRGRQQVEVGIPSHRARHRYAHRWRLQQPELPSIELDLEKAETMSMFKQEKPQHDQGQAVALKPACSIRSEKTTDCGVALSGHSCTAVLLVFLIPTANKHAIAVPLNALRNSK